MSISTPARYRRRVRLSFEGLKSMTEQAHKKEVDIHYIMRKYKETGVVTHVNAHRGTYMDYTDAPNYHEAQTIIADAKSLFESVPSHIRAEMNNDPAQFLAFMQDPNNRDRMEQMGLDASHLPPREEKAKSPTTPPKKPAKPPETSPEADKDV